MLWGMSNCAMVKLIYPQFDQAEFVDGAKHSFEQVNTLMAAGKVDALEGMVSPKILRQVRSFHQERAESGTPSSSSCFAPCRACLS